MKKILLSIVSAILFFSAVEPSHGAGLMKPKNSALPDLQIEDHKVKVTINNGFAITEVDQVFYNPNHQDLDAIYTFPLPKNASLSELSLWINGKEVMGEVVEKEEGRKIAAQEKSAGRETALAEQRDYYAFDVFVSPVRANDRTRVRLVYLQPLEIDGGIGRYVYPLEEGKIDEEMHVFWDRQTKVEKTFAFEAALHSSYPVDDVRVKGFSNAVVTQENPNRWMVQINTEEGGAALDQDLVVYYRLAENQPARVDLLPYRAGNGPGTYMLVITPGADLKQIVEGTDWIFVLDISGSMTDKIASAGDALSRALGEMRPKDRFRLFTFSNNADELTSGFTPVTRETVEQYKSRLLSLRSQGGTNLYSGFEAGLKSLEADRTSALALISDGGANAGPTEFSAFRKLLDKKDIRVFTFVMGQGANQPLLGRLADESGGFSMDVSNNDDLYGRLMQAKAKLAREAMHGIKVALDGVPVADLTPERFGNIYFGQQIVSFGRYLRPGKVTLRLLAKISGEEKKWETAITLPEHEETFPEVERLWALSRIQSLEKQIEDGGERSELREAVITLGTEYSIVSNHTSMVVVHDERFNELGIDRKNQRRVENERLIRQQRQQQSPVSIRVDQNQPMFGDQKAHDVSRSGGSGAVGPAFSALLAGLFAARAWLKKRGK